MFVWKMTPSKPEETIVTKETTTNVPTDPKETDDGIKSFIPGLHNKTD